MIFRIIRSRLRGILQDYIKSQGILVNLFDDEEKDNFRLFKIEQTRETQVDC